MCRKLMGLAFLLGALTSIESLYASCAFVGDHIVTFDGTAPTALVVREGKIAWLGSRAELPSHIGDCEDVVELGPRALLPGFIDAHGHFPFLATMANMVNVASPPVGPVETIADLQRVLLAADDADGEGWLMGRGYDDSLLEERRHPTRDDLDIVSSTRPIALIHVSGHLMAANSAALAAAGIGANTPDPAGGHIRRRAGSDEPNGVLEETATYPLRQHLSSIVPDFALAFREYAENGHTSAQDGASSIGAVQALRNVALGMDLTMFPVVRSVDDARALVESQTFGEYAGVNDRVEIGGVKIILDGSPQGKTAFLEKPYHVPPTGQDEDYRGYPTLPQETVDPLVAYLLEQRVPFLAHANGDAALEMLIDAVAAANPQHDHRSVMIHAQTVREDQLDRMAKLGIIPSFFSAHTFYWGDWHRDSVLGPERGMRISPTRSTVDRQMRFTIHNDAPIVPPNVIRLLWATTNRVTRSGQVLGEDQRISVLEAIKATTIYAAEQHFEEGRKGSITLGKDADLVILSKNPLEMATADLLELDVVATFVGGRAIYSTL